jgi:glyoxylase-like metal-dependent hydrolase (beta-lactamase superfamily II)
VTFVLRTFTFLDKAYIIFTIQLLDLGHLDCEATALYSGANSTGVGKGPIEHERRDAVMISALLSHPVVGLILFDVGSCEDIIKNWHPAIAECTPRQWEKGVHDLPSAIKATGAGTIEDVKAVVISHLHYDHAGGLENFMGTGGRRCHTSYLELNVYTWLEG